MAKEKQTAYRIYTSTRSVLIFAAGKREAKTIFMERFGYWPDDDQMSASKEEEQLAKIKE